MNFKKKRFKWYVVFSITLVAVLMIFTVIVVVQLKSESKKIEKEFSSYFVDRCNKVFVRTKNLYFDKTKQQYREPANKLFGKTLNENELKSQMELRLLTYPGGINNSVLRWKGDLITADQWLYFDKDMNRLGKRNGGGALFFVRADGDGRAVAFYECADESIAENIEKLKSPDGYMDNVGFRVEGLATYDMKFVPLSFTDSKKKINVTNTTDVFTDDGGKKPDDSEIELFDEDYSFRYESSVVSLLPDENVVFYVDYHNNLNDRIVELVKDHKTRYPDEENFTIVKQDKFYEIELINVTNYKPDEKIDEEYNVVTYRYENLFFHPTEFDMENQIIGDKVWGMIYLEELGAAIIAAIVLSIIITKVGNRNKN